jgi:hypothetical protein
MTDDQRAKALELLREPFPAENIGKLPRVSCRDCSQGNGTCREHPNKRKCDECDNYISPKHIHLDYVGHAETTDRLLDADLEWSWEPFALTPQGLPAFDEFGGLWIRLTIAGVPRIGYGAASPGKRGPDAIKEIIGDALRNAGMRFGVALDLWAKTDIHADEREEAPVEQPERPMERHRGAVDDPWATSPREHERPSDGLLTALHTAYSKHGLDKAQRRIDAGLFVERAITSTSELTAAEASKLTNALNSMRPNPVFNALAKLIADAKDSADLDATAADIERDTGDGNLTEIEVNRLEALRNGHRQQLAETATTAREPVGASA